MERNVAGGRGEIPVIVSAAVAPPCLAALIAGRLRQRLRLLFKQLVQRFFHADARQFLDLPLDNFLVQLYNFLGHTTSSPIPYPAHKMAKKWHGKADDTEMKRCYNNTVNQWACSKGSLLLCQKGACENEILSLLRRRYSRRCRFLLR